MKETTFEEKSDLKFYSLGIVIKGEDPVKNDGLILVSPVEAMNIQTPGLIQENHKDFRGGHPNDKGTVVKATVRAENFVKAKWFSMGVSNRVTAPDVYPNETIMLYRYGNHDVFYWTPAFHEQHLRKRENATYAFSNLPKDKGWKSNTEPLSYSPLSSYWFDVDTQNKFVHFSTPKNDKERSRFFVEFDTKKGTLTARDDEGNSIVIDSDFGVRVSTKKTVHVKAELIILDAPMTKITGKLEVAKDVTFGADLRVAGDIYCRTLYSQKAVTGKGSNVSGVASITGNTQNPPKDVTLDSVKIDPDKKDTQGYDFNSQGHKDWLQAILGNGSPTQTSTIDQNAPAVFSEPITSKAALETEREITDAAQVGFSGTSLSPGVVLTPAKTTSSVPGWGDMLGEISTLKIK